MTRADGRTGGRAVGQSRRMWASLGVVVGFLTLCPPDRVSGQTIAITEATIYTGSGPKIERGTVLVRDGRIVAVGTGVVIPADARRIDGRGKVVTPGFFHAQSALGLGVGRSLTAETDEEYTAIGGTTDRAQDGEINASFNVLAGVDPNGIAFPVARMGGITTAVVMPSGGLIAGQAIVLRLAGRSSTEMLVRSPAGMVVDLSDGSRSAGGGSRAGALARLRTVLQDAAELRRRPADWSQNRIQPLAAPARELEALYPVLDGAVPVYVLARRQSDIENAVQLAQEFKLRLIIRGGTEAWRVAERLASARVPVVLDSRDNIPRFDGLQARSDNAALLREAGVTVILAGQDPGGQMNLRFEAGHAVRNGMRWEDALAAVTIAPAEAFGLGQELGSLAPGKSADLVLWSGDPFEFSTGAERVLIRGQEIPLTSRMTELRDRYRTLPPRY